MYIRAKKRMNNKGERVFYLYLCNSKRIEGKVTNEQKYLLSVKEQDLMNGCYIEKLKTKLPAFGDGEMQMLENRVKKMHSCHRKL